MKLTQLGICNMKIEETNKVYALKAWDTFTTVFKTKEDVEDYLKICKNVICCYNPNDDNWSTSGDFSIIPVDRTLVNGIRFYPYAKNCNEN